MCWTICYQPGRLCFPFAHAGTPHNTSERIFPLQEELLLDTVMLRLRTAAGVDLAELRRRFGPEAAAAVAGALAPHEPLGHVWGLDGQGSRCAVAAAQRIRLSDPRGFLMSNDVISDVFAAFDLESLAGEEAAGAE